MAFVKWKDLLVQINIQVKKKQLDEVDKTNKKMRDMAKHFFNLSKGATKFKWAARYVGTFFDSISNKMRRASREFQGWALSIMFGGMWIQRAFQNILMQGTEMLNKITQGASPASQALAMLGGYMDAFKMSIADAVGTYLLQFIDSLAKIADYLLHWIQSNKNLVGSMVTIGIMIGALMFLIGQFVLVVYNGLFVPFAKFFRWLAIVLKSERFAKIAGKIKNIFGGVGRWFLAHPIALMILGAVLLYLAWENNLLGIKDVTKSVFEWIADFVLGIAKGVLTFLSMITRAYVEIYKLIHFGQAPAWWGEASRWLQNTWNAFDEMQKYVHTPEWEKAYMEFKPLTNLFGEAGSMVQNLIGQALGFGVKGAATAAAAGNTEINQTSIDTLNLNLNIPSGGTQPVDFDSVLDQFQSALERHGIKANFINSQI